MERLGGAEVSRNCAEGGGNRDFIVWMRHNLVDVSMARMVAYGGYSEVCPYSHEYVSL